MMSSIPQSFNEFMGSHLDQFLMNLMKIIEREHATQDIEDHGLIQYKDFWLKMVKINDRSIAELRIMVFFYE